jgi:hypothetical protein
VNLLPHTVVMCLQTRDPDVPTSITKEPVVTSKPSGDSKNEAGMIVGLTFMAAVIAAAAVGAGWAYKTGRIGGHRPPPQQYLEEVAGPV